MVSIAAAKANPYSYSRNQFQRLKFSQSLSVRIPFFSEFSSPRLVSVNAHNPNLDSNKTDQSVSEFGSGTGSVAHSQACTSPSAVIDFLTLCHRLKSTKRKGWLNHGIKGPESIADHMYRMALMALIFDDIPGVNRDRLNLNNTVALVGCGFSQLSNEYFISLCIKIAIVHDIAEAIVGDITPSDGVPKEEKSKMEQAALEEMCKLLGGGMRAEEIKELWQEYENNTSVEASLVKDFDKVEMILQALEYETEHGKILDEFFLSTAGKIHSTVGKKWAAEITSRRNSGLAKRAN
ncbi:uncharacterized protein LOC127260690 isoform X1 [Andrographis paniculata]|uniref:uncharacterized protein LOC127260690 isoform X1 n=1 Tax=Andrographis paniculata TaxID=175694 RepID=UPI0021E779D4|nr:uncharacterized protein LOC127260690 isoform X1 [Andrographis paniculata]